MNTNSRFRIRRIHWFVGLFAALVALGTGCQTSRYYRQAVAGQMEILLRQRSIQQVLADPTTTNSLRARLQFALEIRAYAENELSLPVNGHYLRYADLKRRFVVWNVHAAPEFSLEPKAWWYPIVGRLKYQGYFREPDARRYAAALQRKGYDVYVGGVETYSTLGWFRDPLLNTFIFDDETELAELLFHELAHHRVFASGDTDFNEAFATAVAEEGVRRWLLGKNDQDGFRKYHAQQTRREQFVDLVSEARAKLEQLYQAPSSTQQLRAEKEHLFEQLHQDHEQLKLKWGGHGEYDDWFRNSLNNAKLNTVETYYKFVPAFHQLLQENERDLAKFYGAAKRLLKLDKAERRQKLESLLQAARTRAKAETVTQ